MTDTLKTSFDISSNSIANQTWPTLKYLFIKHRGKKEERKKDIDLEA